MAERRMIAKTIVDSDAFLDMPIQTQALYFHLIMDSNDDGFISNPNSILRMVGLSESDLKPLMGKYFENGIGYGISLTLEHRANLIGKRASKSQWKKLRKLVFERDGFTCVYCKAIDTELECDHYYPKSKGGSDDFENLVTACKKCNRRKSDKLPEVFEKELELENE